MGELWENYVMTERLKRQEYFRHHTRSYFWRTYDQKEIDLVEDRNGKLYGYEFKWKKDRVKIPGDWQKHYADASFKVIHQENYREFIL